MLEVIWQGINPMYAMDKGTPNAEFQGDQVSGVVCAGDGTWNGGTWSGNVPECSIIAGGRGEMTNDQVRMTNE
jgi:hypothetical protein